MQGEDLMKVRPRDLDRLKVIREVLERRLKQRQAAELLQISVRQIRKLVRRVRQQGNAGIVHGLRGKPSNRRLAKGVIERAVKLVRERYDDFGPTLANEKLRQVHKIEVSTSALRKALIQGGVWTVARRRSKHRAWRQRRACLGEMVQVDGSTHRWFEQRGETCVLIAYIDDATSRLLYAEFVESEDTPTLLRTTRMYLERYGRPVSWYVDKDSIYKVNRQATIEEQLRDSGPLTQFTRAMGELDIRVITAHSPQAKGRVERLFGTLQDRLVKELRLAGIATIAEANSFLTAQFLAQYNERFAIEPRNATDAHRALRETDVLQQILSIRSERTLTNDFTVQFQSERFQLLADQPVRLAPRDKIVVESRLDGSTHLQAKGHYLNHERAGQKRAGAITRPEVQAQAKARKSSKPAADHPWRRSFLAPKRASVAPRATGSEGMPHR